MSIAGLLYLDQPEKLNKVGDPAKDELDQLDAGQDLLRILGQNRGGAATGTMMAQGSIGARILADQLQQGAGNQRVEAMMRKGAVIGALDHSGPAGLQTAKDTSNDDVREYANTAAEKGLGALRPKPSSRKGKPGGLLAPMTKTGQGLRKAGNRLNPIVEPLEQGIMSLGSPGGGKRPQRNETFVDAGERATQALGIVEERLRRSFQPAQGRLQEAGQQLGALGDKANAQLEPMLNRARQALPPHTQPLRHVGEALREVGDKANAKINPLLDRANEALTPQKEALGRVGTELRAMGDRANAALNPAMDRAQKMLPQNSAQIQDAGKSLRAFGDKANAKLNPMMSRAQNALPAYNVDQTDAQAHEGPTRMARMANGMPVLMPQEQELPEGAMWEDEWQAQLQAPEAEASADAVQVAPATRMARDAAGLPFAVEAGQLLPPGAMWDEEWRAQAQTTTEVDSQPQSSNVRQAAPAQDAEVEVARETRIARGPGGMPFAVEAGQPLPDGAMWDEDWRAEERPPEPSRDIPMARDSAYVPYRLPDESVQTQEGPLVDESRLLGPSGEVAEVPQSDVEADGVCVRRTDDDGAPVAPGADAGQSIERPPAAQAAQTARDQMPSGDGAVRIDGAPETSRSAEQVGAASRRSPSNLGQQEVAPNVNVAPQAVTPAPEVGAVQVPVTPEPQMPRQSDVGEPVMQTNSVPLSPVAEEHLKQQDELQKNDQSDPGEDVPRKSRAQLESEAQMVGEKGKREAARVKDEMGQDAEVEAQGNREVAQSERDATEAQEKQRGDAQIAQEEATGQADRAAADAQGEQMKAEAESGHAQKEADARQQGSQRERDAEATRDSQTAEQEVLEQQRVAAEEKRSAEEQAELEAGGERDKAQAEQQGRDDEAAAQAWGEREKARVRCEGEAEQTAIRQRARGDATRAEQQGERDAADREAEGRAAARREEERGRREKRRKEAEARRRKSSQGWLSRAASWVSSQFNNLMNAARNIWNRARRAARNLINRAREAARAIIARARAAATRIYQAADRACGGVLSRVANSVRQFGQRVVARVKAVVKRVADTVRSIANRVREAISSAIQRMKAAIVAIRDRIRDAINTIVETCRAAIAAARKWVQDTLEAARAWLQEKIQQAVTWVRDKYAEIRDRVKAAVTAIVATVTNAVRAAYDYCAKKLQEIGEALAAAWQKFKEWAQEAFVAFWNGPWRDVLIGVAVAVLIAATVATGGAAGILLAAAVGAAATGAARFGGEVVARRCTVAIKNDPERAARFEQRMREKDPNFAESDFGRWYGGVSEDEGWGHTLKQGAWEGARGAAEGAVSGLMGGASGALGNIAAKGIGSAATKEGAKFLARRGVARTAEWGARAGIEFTLNAAGDVGQGYTLAYIDVTSGRAESWDEAKRRHVDPHLNPKALLAKAAGAGISGGLRMGAHATPSSGARGASFQDKLVDRVAGGGAGASMRTRVVAETVDASMSGLEGGTTAGMVSLANGGTFMDGFGPGFAGGTTAHYGRIAGEGTRSRIHQPGPSANRARVDTDVDSDPSRVRVPQDGDNSRLQVVTDDSLPSRRQAEVPEVDPLNPRSVDQDQLRRVVGLDDEPSFRRQQEIDADPTKAELDLNRVRREGEDGPEVRRAEVEDPDGTQDLPVFDPDKTLEVDVNSAHARRLEADIAGKHGIPADQRVVPDSTNPVPPGAITVTQAQRWKRTLIAMAGSETGRATLKHIQEKNLRVQLSNDTAASFDGANNTINLGMERRSRHHRAGILAHEGSHSQTRHLAPDFHTSDKDTYIRGMMVDEARAQSALLEHYRESGLASYNEAGDLKYHEAYNAEFNRLRTENPSMDPAEVHTRAKQAGVEELATWWGDNVRPNVVATLPDGTPASSYTEYYGRWHDEGSASGARASQTNASNRTQTSDVDTALPASRHRNTEAPGPDVDGVRHRPDVDGGSTQRVRSPQNHPGVELHNHMLGVLDVDYFVKNAAGGDQRVLYDRLRGMFNEQTKRGAELRNDAPDLVRVLEKAGPNPPDQELGGLLNRLLSQTDDTPFDAAYSPRDELIKAHIDNVPVDPIIRENADAIAAPANGADGSYRNFTEATMRRLNADGISYSEQSISINKLNKRLPGPMMAELRQKLQAEGKDVDMRFLAMVNTDRLNDTFINASSTRLLDSYGISAEQRAAALTYFRGDDASQADAFRRLSTADASELRKAGFTRDQADLLANQIPPFERDALFKPGSADEASTGLLLRSDVMGIDIAAPERNQFTEAGMRRFEGMYETVLAASRERGRPLTLRPHVGEGYADLPAGAYNRNDVPMVRNKVTGVDEPAHYAVARNNMDMMLTSLENVAARHNPGGNGALPPDVIVRFGHATHADPVQVARMKKLGIYAEANLNSNVETGSLNRQKVDQLGEARPELGFEDHSLLNHLWAENPVILSTDAHGVMHTTMRGEYEAAQSIIDDFQSGRTTLKVPSADDPNTLIEVKYADLSPVQQQRFSMDRLYDAAENYRKRVYVEDSTDGTGAADIQLKHFAPEQDLDLSNQRMRDGPLAPGPDDFGKKPNVATSDDPDPRTYHKQSDGTEKEHSPTYKRLGEELFHEGGVTKSDPNQGYCGDCYLIAGMGAIAKQRPDLIQGMFTDHNDGTVTVSFYTDRRGQFSPYPGPDTRKVEIRVNKDLPTVNGRTPTYAKGSQGQLWPGLMEKAYAIHMKGGEYQGMNTGGSAARAMELITGGRSLSYATTSRTPRALLTELDVALRLKKPVAVGSMSKDMLKTDANLRKLAQDKDVVAWHAYILDSVDPKTNEVRLLNPWGSRHPKPMTIEEFQTLYRNVYINEPPSNSPELPSWGKSHDDVDMAAAGPILPGSEFTPAMRTELGNDNTTYRRRQEIVAASRGEIQTFEAYTLGNSIPEGWHARMEFLNNPDNWTPPRRRLHDKLVENALSDAHRFAELTAESDPTLFAMRGNTAAGKTRAIKGNIGELEFAVEATKDTPHRAINPDNFKLDLLKHDEHIPQTHTQVHRESSVLAGKLYRRLLDMKHDDGSSTSMLVDKRLLELEDVTELAAGASATGRKFNLYDVDAPLELSLIGVLMREPGGADPIPPFSVVADDGFVGARKYRAEVINEFIGKEDGNYELYATNASGDKEKIAWVENGELTIADGQHAKFEEVTSDPTAHVQRIRHEAITPASIDKITAELDPGFAASIRKAVEPYMGMTWEAALAAHSKA